MKTKAIFLMMLSMTLAFTSCTNSAENTEAVETTTDSTFVDTTSVSVDSLVVVDTTSMW
jgi:ABC-type Zn uptake system ZnuABC Zn-binding protein ZnuA